MLTPKERLEKVLNHQEVDRPPCICPRRVRSIAVKSTELNTEKGLKIKHFRELGVRFSSALLDNK